jgi:RHS repeat-associated protein
VATPFKFAGGHGYQADADSGLMLLGARYYDASVGRFISRDPIGYEGGLNVYSYCTNGPTSLIDPEGLDAGWAGRPFPNDPYGIRGTTPYDSHFGAAVDMMMTIWPGSRNEQMEYVGYIIPDPSGGYTSTPPQPYWNGYGNPLKLKFPEGAVGWWHTHPFKSREDGRYDPDFSDADRRTSDVTGLPGYVITPRDIRIYDPNAPKGQRDTVLPIDTILKGTKFKKYRPR